jgi:hypothetical protein
MPKQPSLPDIDRLSDKDLRALVIALLGEVTALKEKVAVQAEEIARLKGLKAKPSIKPSSPSGMDKATKQADREWRKKQRRGAKKPSAPVEEKVIAATNIPPGSRFKGYESFTIQDLKIEPRVVCYRRERWLTPDGRTIVAPLPGGIGDHFGPEIKRFILAQYHQGRNGFCTQIGNDAFTYFATTFSKSRSNFLGLLRAGHDDYVVNDQAFAYMRRRNLAGPVIAKLAAHPARQFADEKAWLAHLDSLGISALKVHPDPVMIVTEGALWGAIIAHGFLDGTVILSDDAGQFNVGEHALCWVHAERLVHKLETFTEATRAAKEKVRALIWWLYADLKAYCAAPESRRKAAMKARFDRIFKRQTGFATLDRLLERLHANKPELLRVLNRPEIPLHTNGSENDIRCQVIRRKISGTTRSDTGRDARDAFLGLRKTCQKLGISFWDYLGARLGALSPETVPRLPDIVAAHCAT